MTVKFAMEYGYTAVKRYIATDKYKSWCKLFHVHEIVSIDMCLCQKLIKIMNLSEEDYNHAIWLGQFVAFRDLEYLLNKPRDKDKYQILALAFEPELDCSRMKPDERFRFYGYDLMDYSAWISALSNCGGFDKAFLPEDLNPYGLVDDYFKVRQIQQKLLEEYPFEPHADCSVFAIWRMDQ